MARNLSLLEILVIFVTAILSIIAIFTVLTDDNWIVLSICIVGIIAMVVLLLRHTVNPDRLRARQSERMLNIATSTLTYMRTGLNFESVEAVCRLILPATNANAVAITDDKIILGYAGAEKNRHEIGSPIRTQATLNTIKTTQMQVLTTKEEIGFLDAETSFVAAIVVPMIHEGDVAGTLKFYYRSAKKIDATEQAVALGLSSLLGMQLGLSELDYQRELAAKMELKALQAQIRPHFLFNTINTIASFIRTDPTRARILLREFATFYRRTLEGSLDEISLEQEFHQTMRYLGFEIARFGADKVMMESDIQKGLEGIRVPAFIIQPLVENAVGHGLRDDAPLHIVINAHTVDGGVIIDIIDDGRGMSKTTLESSMTSNKKHAGVALKNVDDRLRGFFGRNAYLEVQSELGVGTKVSLNLGPITDLKVEANDQSDNS